MRTAFVALVFFFCTSCFVYAQCSDAGVCSLAHSHNAAQAQDSSKQSHIGMRYIFGQGAKEDSVSFQTIRLEADYAVSSNLRVSFQLPYSLQDGPKGSVAGIGDAIFLGDYRFYTTDNLHFYCSAGLRLPLGNDSAKNLPQVYQSSLGSTDILLGLRTVWQNVSFTLGYQIAGKRNNNALLLQRADDILLSAGYNYQSGAWLFAPEVLAIIRTGESSIASLTVPVMPNYRKVSGSKQTQLNLGASFGYQFSEQWSAKAYAALPLLKRPVNVDGLTRAITLSAGIEMAF